MPELDTQLSSWPYDLAWLFLNAATCCGFECSRTFVADGTLVEGMPPECKCQLAAVVDASWESVQQGSMALCLPRKQATVTLVLDLCVVLPDGNNVPEPKDVSNSARETVTARWRILRGLQQARAAGNLGGACRSVTIGPWVGVSQSGGMARWQTVARFVTE